MYVCMYVCIYISIYLSIYKSIYLPEGRELLAAADMNQEPLQPGCSHTNPVTKGQKTRCKFFRPIVSPRCLAETTISAGQKKKGLLIAILDQINGIGEQLDSGREDVMYSAEGASCAENI